VKHSWAGPVSANMEARADWLIDEQDSIEFDIQRLINVLALCRISTTSTFDAYRESVKRNR
jgi:hypothetical protein